MYAFFKIATWLNDSNNYEVVLSWLSEHLDNSDRDSDGGSSDGGGSSGSDGGGD